MAISLETRMARRRCLPEAPVLSANGSARRSVALAQDAPDRGHAGAEGGEKSDGGRGEHEAEVSVNGEAGGEIMRDGAQNKPAEQRAGEDAEHGCKAGEQQYLADEEQRNLRAGCA